MNERVAKVNFQKVNELINLKYLSWLELSKKARISSATVFAIKAGRRNASYKTIRKIAAALDVDPSEIIKQ